ncbi:MAG: class I SAM-dependent methyltransferase [Clostridia bacterium]|mgnify:CR=1 FL=1|jgi:SAM-dependent methyltransferase|nr:class I SAM-dependent methyltransferase [Clostridiaceae bacterium]
MDTRRLKEEWEALAPRWIKEVREGGNSVRKGLIDPVMLKALGNVEGLRILDCGCGEGRFCRLLAERGAKYVLGLDLCEPMIEAAKNLQSEREEYRIRDVQDLSFLESESFDLAISYLNQCDLPDFESNVRETYRVLKKGGRFIIANLHPMRSASGKWYKDESGRKLHVMLDQYFDEGERHWEMLGVKFTNFHRSLSTYINCFINTGFVLNEIIEPTVTEDKLTEYPDLEDELRVPNFIVYVLEKPL